MQAPLTGELRQLFIVFAKDDMDRLSVNVFFWLDGNRLFNEKPQSSDNRSLV
jgi:hypothetical protein